MSLISDRLDGIQAGVAIKAACKYLTTGNITLSGLGVQANGEWASTLTDGDRIFALLQTDPVDRGIWVASSSSWSRAKDFDGARDAVQGTLIPVYRGENTYALYAVSAANPIRIGTTSLTFELVTDAALTASLANDTDVDLGSNLVGHYDALSAAYLKTVSDIINGSRVSFLRFVPRAKHAGIFAKTNTDDLQTNMQDACSAGAYQLELTRGLVHIGSAVSVTNPMEFCGEGAGELSIIAGTNATQNMFNITTEGNGDSVSFRNLSLSTTVSKTAGTTISYAPAGATQHNQAVIENVYFNGQANAVDFQKAAYWTMRGCHFLGNVANQQIIKARNTTTPDSGDATFENNWFYGGSGCTGLRYESGGGLRVRGNKFLQLGTGIDATLSSGVVTGIFFVRGNSFDGCTSNGLSITTADGTVTFTDINVTSNIFNGSPSVSHIYAALVSGADLGRGLISGNNLLRNSGTAPVISIVSGGNWSVTNNLVNGPAVVGISIGVDVTNSLVAMNQMEGMTISNSSPTTLVVDSKSGATLALQVGAKIVGNSTIMIENVAAWSDGAGALTGTLTNSPVTGNPTKWIAAVDSSGTYYIPGWKLP